MTQRSDYPLEQALSDLEMFFSKRIKNTSDLDKFTAHIEDCRSAKKIGFRFIHEELMKYRKNNSDYFYLDSKERQMIDDLLCFWG
jgi:hypothetical protein